MVREDIYRIRGGISLSALIDDLRDLRPEGFDEICVEIKAFRDYGETYANVNIVGKRAETKEEIAQKKNIELERLEHEKKAINRRISIIRDSGPQENASIAAMIERETKKATEETEE